MFLIVSVAALTVRPAAVRTLWPCPLTHTSARQGTPISGAIISRSNGSYVGAFVCAGCFVMVGSCFNAAAWWVVSREKGTRWV